MLVDILTRLLVGGLVVSLFAAVGDVVEPKSFAGLFGAAPSVALVTLFLTAAKEGQAYAKIEARSMVLGALAFLVYAYVVRHFLLQGKWSALRVSGSALTVWCVCAFGLWWLFVK